MIRNAGVGCTTMCSRIGSLLAPLVIALSDVAAFLPLTIMGALATVQSLLIFLLPETSGMSLPDTMDDLKVSGRYILILYVKKYQKCFYIREILGKRNIVISLTEIIFPCPLRQINQREELKTKVMYEYVFHCDRYF